MQLPDISDKKLIKGLDRSIERDSSKPINFDTLTGEEKIDLIRDIVEQHQYQKVKSKGHVEILDGVTANAILLIYDNINDENKKKFASWSLHRMVDFAWSHIK